MRRRDIVICASFDHPYELTGRPSPVGPGSHRFEMNFDVITK